MLKNLKKFLLYLLVTIGLILLYEEGSHFFVESGGMSGRQKYVEFPIIALVLVLLYFPKVKVWKNIFLSLVPIVGTYLLYDVFYMFLARSPRYSDLSNVMLLQDFSYSLMFGFFLVVLVVFGAIFYLIVLYRRLVGRGHFWRTLALKFSFILVLGYLFNSAWFHDYVLHKFKYYVWSQATTIRKNGRFTSFLYYGIKSAEAKEKLQRYHDLPFDVNRLLYGTSEIVDKRDIYIVVLESFLDPRLLKDVVFSQSPLYLGLKKYLSHGDFSHVISPVYGGGTSQAEFEVLTGVRALAKVNSIEFNVLDGGCISGFVNMLRKNGYHTYAEIATGSGYYNSKVAYGSIGFDSIDFLEENENFHQNKDDVKIFDGDLYRYILYNAKLGKYRQPSLVYALGMYGHFPYARNLKLRPDVISVNSKDERIHRLANQFYYRTKALSAYIDTILAHNAHGVIYVTSDHIPPLLDKDVCYQKDQYTNISLLLVDGKPIDVDGLHYYDIPRLIYHILTDDQSKLIPIDAKKAEEIYFKTLAESLQ